MAEDIQEGELVLVGMFMIHDGPVFILFNSGGSHNFISMACAEKLHLTSYVITSPDVRINTT
jgi:hypothetical protein